MKPHYTVIWSKTARQQLAEIWLRVSGKKAFSQCVDDFDAALKSNPDAVVAQNREGLRIADFPGLRIIFTVSQEDRIVHVVRIRETH